MCQWCGSRGSAEGTFALVERGAERLTGRSWRGTSDEVASGAVRSLVSSVGEVARGITGLPAAAVLVVTWADGPDRWRSFAGLPGGTLLGSLEETVAFPPMRFLLGIHEGDADGIVDHYRHMLAWMEGRGLAADHREYHHREEYMAVTPRDAHGGGLRLMLPVREFTPASRYSATQA